MKDRIGTLLLKKHLSPNEFANRLNMNRSNVSHLLSGRSKLSIDNLAILMKEFPDISIEWLLSGEGNIFKFDTATQNNIEKVLPEITPSTIQNTTNSTISTIENVVANTVNVEDDIEQIIIFYKSKTCKVYKCKS